MIVCDNGISGFMGEHSCMDGTPTLRMNEFLLGSISAGKILPESTMATSIPEPVELTFNLDDKTKQFVATAEKNFDKLIGDQELEVSAAFPLLYQSRVNLLRSSNILPSVLI